MEDDGMFQIASHPNSLGELKYFKLDQIYKIKY